jgi:hypothetical protein
MLPTPPTKNRDQEKNLMRTTIAVLALMLACGCGSGATGPAIGGGTTPAPDSVQPVLGQFTATWDPASDTLTFAPVGYPIVLNDNLTPQSIDTIPISQSGGGTSQPPSTVDLVSTGCVNGYPTTPTFHCNVEIRSYYTRALPNVVAVITSATVAGVNSQAYDATNADGVNPLGIASCCTATDHGLWVYENGSTFQGNNTPDGLASFLSANDGSNGGNGNGLNTGTREWIFANPLNQSVSYGVTIYASKGYSSYTFGFPTSSYVAVCPAAGGSGTSHGSTSGTAALPFDFALYGSWVASGTALKFARNGIFTVGATIPVSGTSVALPSLAAAHPAFFAFWDNLAEGGNLSANMCTKMIGTAPNRQFAIEWYNFDFSAPPPGSSADGPGKGSSLNFEVFLDEGTYEIDTVYNVMTLASGGTAGRASGSLMTVGVQDITGTVSTSEHNNDLGDSFGTGSAWSYTGNP